MMRLAARVAAFSPLRTGIRVSRRETVARSVAARTRSAAYAGFAASSEARAGRLAFGALGGIAGGLFGATVLVAQSTAVEAGGDADVGQRRAGLPDYTRKQVAEHMSKETGIWVYYKDGVYDITDFINRHPGGAKRIMLAAGPSGTCAPPTAGPPHRHPLVPTVVRAACRQVDRAVLEYLPAASRRGHPLLHPSAAGPHARGELDPRPRTTRWRSRPTTPTSTSPNSRACFTVHTERAFNAEPPKNLIGQSETPSLSLPRFFPSVSLSLSSL
jgi:Cytochrome b involved in lipid metabolism